MKTKAQERELEEARQQLYEINVKLALAPMYSYASGLEIILLAVSLIGMAGVIIKYFIF